MEVQVKEHTPRLGNRVRLEYNTGQGFAQQDSAAAGEARDARFVLASWLPCASISGAFEQFFFKFSMRSDSEEGQKSIRIFVEHL